MTDIYLSPHSHHHSPGVHEVDPLPLVRQATVCGGTVLFCKYFQLIEDKWEVASCLNNEISSSLAIRTERLEVFVRENKTF